MGNYTRLYHRRRCSGWCCRPGCLKSLLSFQGVASFARVRMSMSAVDIPVGGELRIKVDGTVPNIISQDFNKLRCGFLPHGSTQMDALGEYDARASRFDFPSEGQPSRFNGRISFEGNDTIKIGSIRFEDKSTIFYCILDYYVGPLKLHVETMKHQLQNVYSKYDRMILVINFFGIV